MTRKEFYQWYLRSDYINGGIYAKTEETMSTKKCKVCGRELPLSEFSKHKMTKDGFHTTCKTCMKKKIDAGQSAKAQKRCEVEVPAEPMPTPRVTIKPEAIIKRFGEDVGLGKISDDTLISELQRRGYKGKLTKEYEI